VSMARKGQMSLLSRAVVDEVKWEFKLRGWRLSQGFGTNDE